jgi:hypothetical protein
MGTENIPDPCGGGCCGTPGCVGCQCSPFVVPSNVKITVATRHEITDYNTFPFTHITEIFSSVYTPLATDPTSPCSVGLSPMSAAVTNSIGLAYGTSASLLLASALGLCNINSSSFAPSIFQYTVAYTYRSGHPKSELINGFTGGVPSTPSTSCNPDGTWVITVTFSDQVFDYSSGGTDNYASVIGITVTIECLP